MNIGFIGAGNMAGAILKGALTGGVVLPAQIHVFDVDAMKPEQLQNEFGVVAHDTCASLIDASDILLLAVKPQQLAHVLSDLHECFSGKAVISIAAGWTTDMLIAALPEATRVLRVMPNTPALVGEGMSALSKKTDFVDQEKLFAEKLFRSLGRAVWVDEGQMEAVIGVSGSGPAYGYLFIEALADAGVALGLPRMLSIEMAAQTLLGASKMALETGQHPGMLKDMVCSPGGTTIEAVRSLEQNGFRGAVITAAIVAAEKAKAMQK